MNRTDELTTIQSGTVLGILAARIGSTVSEAWGRSWQNGITVDAPPNTIRSIYTLEFCGLPTRKRYSERQLETALIKNQV